MSDGKIDDALNKLPPKVRDRVEAALRHTLESELSAEALNPTEAAAFSRSKGPIFSKSRTSNALRDELVNPSDQVILRDVSKMADEDFHKFAERISALRKIKGE